MEGHMLKLLKIATVSILLATSHLAFSDDRPKLNNDSVYPLMFLLGSVTPSSVKPSIDENQLYQPEDHFPKYSIDQTYHENNLDAPSESHQAKSASAWLLGTMFFSDKDEKVSLQELRKYGEEEPYNPCKTITKPSLVKNDPTTLKCFGQ